MKPPERRRSTRTAVTCPKEVTTTSKSYRWTVAEKKKLLQGLNLYGIDRPKDVMTDFVPTKSVDQISQFVRTFQLRAKVQYKKLADQPAEIKAPIEMWLSLAEELTRFDNDYSYVISRVLGIMGNLEPHDDAYTSRDANWSLLYQYLSALLAGSSDLPKLGAIEAVVVVDLIQGLADLLKELDLGKQRLLMERKHQLLTSLFNNRDRTAVMEQLTLALVKDPLEEVAAFTSNTQAEPVTTQQQQQEQQQQQQQQQQPTSSADDGNEDDPPSMSSAMSAALDLTTQQGAPSANQNIVSADSANQNIVSADSATANHNSSLNLSANPSISSTPAANDNSTLTGQRRRGRQRRGASGPAATLSTPPQRSELHSINPFCVPIKYLRPMKK